VGLTAADEQPGPQFISAGTPISLSLSNFSSDFRKFSNFRIRQCARNDLVQISLLAIGPDFPSMLLFRFKK
jgi:hypothetical protein